MFSLNDVIYVDKKDNGPGMVKRKDLETLFEKHGYCDYKWIKPENIVVAQWVRLKCMYGCPGYGECAVCPPHVPSVAECEKFFNEYKKAVVFHFEKKVKKPDDRHKWTRRVNQKLLKLEREVFLSGYRRAFLLFMDTCGICSDCAKVRVECKRKALARPAPEALAVDVFSTVKPLGFPIEVLSHYKQTMNRYAFLMID